MTLQNNDRERAFRLIYRGPRYFLFSCDRSLQVLPNWRLRNQRQGEQGLSDIIVHGTSLFLRGMRFLADFGHGASCIAFRCARARKFAPRKGREIGMGHPHPQGRAALSREIAEQLTGLVFTGAVDCSAPARHLRSWGSRNVRRGGKGPAG